MFYYTAFYGVSRQTYLRPWGSQEYNAPVTKKRKLQPLIGGEKVDTEESQTDSTQTLLSLHAAIAFLHMTHESYRGSGRGKKAAAAGKHT